MNTKLFELKIVADTNDADYETALTAVSMEEIQALLPIIAKIQPEAHNWENGHQGDLTVQYAGILTEEEIELFSNYLPYGEYGIHTIERIEYYPIPRREILFSQ